MDYPREKNEIIETNGKSEKSSKSYYHMADKTRIKIIKVKLDKETETLDTLYKELEQINENLINSAIFIKKD